MVCKIIEFNSFFKLIYLNYYFFTCEKVVINDKSNGLLERIRNVLFPPQISEGDSKKATKKAQG